MGIGKVTEGAENRKVPRRVRGRSRKRSERRLRKRENFENSARRSEER